MHLNLPSPDWKQAPDQPSLEPHQIHLWLVEVDAVSQPQLQQLSCYLSEDEQQRAAKFHFALHRRRFIANRGILRSLLGRYLHCHPKTVTFSYGAHGKPLIANPKHQLGLQFNVSHSERLCLIAIAQQHQVGIDLEQHRGLTDLNALAQRFFTVNEYAAIQALPDIQKPGAFFQYWTGKEALLKGLGVGLSGLSQIELSITPGQVGWAMLQAPGLSQQEWMVELFTPALAFTAAIAIKTKHPIEIAYWQWSEG
ncbi:MAG: 4'-phosphopantetheinyl transferase family protein [Leptolyngbyaceae cyanobacterium]